MKINDDFYKRQGRFYSRAGFECLTLKQRKRELVRVDVFGTGYDVCCRRRSEVSSRRLLGVKTSVEIATLKRFQINFPFVDDENASAHSHKGLDLETESKS